MTCCLLPCMKKPFKIKWGLVLNERISPRGANSLLKELTSIQKRGKICNTVTDKESVCFDLMNICYL